MKKMILQMTAAQLLMQIILTLYNLAGHLIRSAEGDSRTPDFGTVVMLLIACVPSMLFCMLEPALRVQNHCRKRWRHVIACLFFWGLECAAFLWLAIKLTASGLFPPCGTSEAENYRLLPVFSFVISGMLALVWFPSERCKEKRIARLYGRNPGPEE
ncbi:MAG: hypothetical protein J5722_12230 [Oscillospiraceae bacterium]|nr:hypothetical protein [Oscillospiraceae bacterium]